MSSFSMENYEISWSTKTKAGININKLGHYFYYTLFFKTSFRSELFIFFVIFVLEFMLTPKSGKISPLLPSLVRIFPPLPPFNFSFFTRVEGGRESPLLYIELNLLK